MTLDADGADLPSDWYLKLPGEITRMFRGDISPTRQMPLARRAYSSVKRAEVRPNLSLLRCVSRRGLIQTKIDQAKIDQESRMERKHENTFSCRRLLFIRDDGFRSKPTGRFG